MLPAPTCFAQLAAHWLTINRKQCSGSPGRVRQAKSWPGELWCTVTPGLSGPSSEREDPKGILSQTGLRYFARGQNFA